MTTLGSIVPNREAAISRQFVLIWNIRCGPKLSTSDDCLTTRWSAR